MNAVCTIRYSLISYDILKFMADKIMREVCYRRILSIRIAVSQLFIPAHPS